MRREDIAHVPDETTGNALNDALGSFIGGEWSLRPDGHTGGFYVSLTGVSREKHVRASFFATGYLAGLRAAKGGA